MGNDLIEGHKLTQPDGYTVDDGRPFLKKIAFRRHPPTLPPIHSRRDSSACGIPLVILGRVLESILWDW